MALKIVFLSFLILFLIASSAAYAFNLPDTGQTKCYRDVSPYDEIPCAGTGQDGEQHGAYIVKYFFFTVSVVL
ncbi:MAG: hypothetical protein HY757_04240 [Nitrospirae bacterium]|nr:hypothetical protein [Nitrospirota bacterium]